MDDNPRPSKKPYSHGKTSTQKKPDAATSSAVRTVLLEWLIDCLHDGTCRLSQKQESVRLICQLVYVRDSVDIMKLVTAAEDDLLPTYGSWLMNAPLCTLEPHIDRFVDIACNTTQHVSTWKRIMACDTLSALFWKRPKLFKSSHERVFGTLRWYEDRLRTCGTHESERRMLQQGISAVLRVMTSVDLPHTQNMNLAKLLHLGDGVWVSAIEYMSRRHPDKLSVLRHPDLVPVGQTWTVKMMASSLSDDAQCIYAKAILQLMSGRQWHELPLLLETVSYLRPCADELVTQIAIRCLEVRRTRKLIWDSVCRILNGVPVYVLGKHTEDLIRVLSLHYIRYYCSGCDIGDITTILSRLKGARETIIDLRFNDEAYTLLQRMTMYLMLPASDLLDSEILDDIVTCLTSGYNENKEWFLCVEVAKRVPAFIFQDKQKDSIRRKMQDVPTRQAINAMTLFPGDLSQLHNLAASTEVDVETRSLALHALGSMADANLLRDCMADKKMRGLALSMIDKITPETFHRLQSDLGRYILQGNPKYTRHFTRLPPARVHLLSKYVKKYMTGKLREGSVEAADPVLHLFASLPLHDTRKCLNKTQKTMGDDIDPPCMKTYLGAVASMPSHVLRQLEPEARKYLNECRKESIVILLRARRTHDPQLREIVKECFIMGWMDRKEVVQCIIDSGDMSLLQEMLQDYKGGAWDTDLCRTLRKQCPVSLDKKERPMGPDEKERSMCVDEEERPLSLDEEERPMSLEEKERLEKEKKRLEEYWRYMLALEMEACSFRYRYA